MYVNTVLLKARVHRIFFFFFSFRTAATIETSAEDRWRTQSPFLVYIQYYIEGILKIIIIHYL